MEAEGFFRAELEAAGLRPAEIIADGHLHRCPVEGKPEARDGAYVLYPDEPPSGWWQNWRSGEEGTWSAGHDRTLSQEERHALAQRMEVTRRQRETEQAAAWAEAARRAQALLDQAWPCQAHPYLEAKGVRACPGLKLNQAGRLLVPVLGPDDKGQSLQTITGGGEKRFLPGGKMAGGYFPIKGADPAGPLLVCEGLATGLSLHEATSHTVLVAFTAGNLEALARMAREKYPERSITICADDDHATPGNPGRTKAQAAALAVGGKLALPVFTGDRTGKTDLNDLHQAEGLEAVTRQVEAAREPEPDAPAQQAQGENQPARDWPFRVSESGVFYRAEDSEGNPDWQWVCSPLEVMARTRDSQGEGWGRLLKVVDADGKPHVWSMPMSLTAGNGDEYRARLKSMGLDLAPGRKGKERLELYLMTAKPEARARCTSRVGWNAGAFILPDAGYGDTAGEEVVFQGGLAHDHAFRVAGTMEDWQEHLAHLCEGNSRLAFAVSAAFAAPLLHLAGMESGGFHLRGGSSLGKTTALLVAGSVWGGGGVSGYCRNWRATSNGLEAVGLAHCDALLCLDEMGQVDGREAGETAYMLANSQGKTRSRRDGTGRPPAQWRVLFLSTGELSLADKMNEAGRKTKAGQEVRLVDLAADAGVGLGLFENLHNFGSAQALADHLRRAAGIYYGRPARAFLERITADLDGLGQTVNEAVVGFVAEYCPAGADGQVKRVAGRFGLVAAAGELAGAVGVLPWPEDEAKRAAAACFQSWLDQRGGVGAQETAAGLAQVRRFFQAHELSRFEPWEGMGERVIVNRAGFVRQGTEGRVFILFPEIFKEEVSRGFDHRALARALVAHGVLVPDPDGRPTQSMRLPGTGKTARVYVLRAEVVAGGDE